MSLQVDIAMRSEHDNLPWRKKNLPKIVNGYLFGDTIGEGSYGKVKEVLEVSTLVRRAVKIIKAVRLRKIPNGRANVEQELRILRRVHHRNVISLRDVFRDCHRKKLYMVMEYAACSLQQMLDGSDEKKLPVFQAHFFFTQLIEGLSYLHSQGVIHKDIKPGNLLVSLDGTLKISDFGVAELLSHFAKDDWCRIAQGTPKFQPPEIVSGIVEEYRGRKVDIWACGVTLYNLVSGEYPFEGDVIMRLFDNIANQPLKMPQTVTISSDLEALLTRLLEKDPDKRIDICGIRNSIWFKNTFVPVCSFSLYILIFCIFLFFSFIQFVFKRTHRPLSVYAALEQMFCGAMEDSSSLNGEEVTADIPQSDTSASRARRLAASDGSFSNVCNAPGSSSGLTETRRNRSM
uniref:non-specific serine/threonine protein kinase n=1 Tax=Syphacia muris TaxID=451379 RepID=A0A0N5AX46_9BILA